MIVKRDNYKLRITKCYLVEVCDKNEKEILGDFCFGAKEEAIAFGDRLAKKGGAHTYEGKKLD